jgi:hypothetical protein
MTFNTSWGGWCSKLRTCYFLVEHHKCSELSIPMLSTTNDMKGALKKSKPQCRNLCAKATFLTMLNVEWQPIQWLHFHVHFGNIDKTPCNEWAKSQCDDENPWQDVQLYRVCAKPIEHDIMWASCHIHAWQCPCPIMSYPWVMHDIVPLHTRADLYVQGSIPCITRTWMFHNV